LRFFSEVFMKTVDVAIIGAGTAGLSARREVAKVTDSYVVIDDGILGTTCARVGCMPSKVLIQVAEDFHRRHALAEQGISGGEQLTVDTGAVMAHVRSLRDRFVRSVMGSMEDWQDKLIRKRARFVDAHTLDLGDEQIRARRVIIATGSSPILPAPWRPLAHRLIDTDAFFERETLPDRVAVIGLGVIGLELGQALARLGVEVVAVSLDKAFGGLTDPALQDYAHRTFAEAFPVHLSGVSALSEDAAGDLVLHLADGTELAVDAALLTMGRRPNLSGLGIADLGVPMQAGIPAFDPSTFKVSGQPWYIAGDTNGARPLLHEASDEGRIAGYNAVRAEDQCFRRRTALAITFSDPGIAMVGASHAQLTAQGADFVTGRVSYEGQGRAIVKLKERGLLHVYADRSSGVLLGAELLAPDGEHLAHLLAWAMAASMDLRTILSLPFYHPVLEEGLRTAVRHASRQLDATPPPLEVLRCADPPVGVSA
jgi:dihydrolipoamide dehydrogenase